MSWHQVLAGQAGRAWACGALYGVRYTDMCAFRAIRRMQPGWRCGMREMTYGWNIEMQMKAARAGLRILEVPMPYRCRAGGQSKVAGSLRGTLRAGWRIVSDVRPGRRRPPAGRPRTGGEAVAPGRHRRAGRVGGRRAARRPRPGLRTRWP